MPHSTDKIWTAGSGSTPATLKIAAEIKSIASTTSTGSSLDTAACAPVPQPGTGDLL